MEIDEAKFMEAVEMVIKTCNINFKLKVKADTTINKILIILYMAHMYGSYKHVSLTPYIQMHSCVTIKPCVKDHSGYFHTTHYHVLRHVLPIGVGSFSW